MENKLTKWFDAAKQIQPIISTNEIEAMISNKPAVKARYSIFKTSIFMGTLLITLIGVWYFVSAPLKTQTENKIIKTTQQVAQNTKVQAALLSNKGAINNKLKAPKQQVGSTKSTIENNAEEKSIEGDNSALRQRISETVYDANNGFIYLTNEELAQLGIITDGNTLKYENTTDSVWHIDSSETPSEYMGTFLLKVEEHGSRRIVTNRTSDSIFVKRSKSFWPAAIQIIDVKKDTDLIVVETMAHSPEFEYPFFYELNPLLIPVFVTTKAKPSRYSHNLNYIFWFKPEEVFFDALPSIVSSELKERFTSADLKIYKERAKQHRQFNARMWVNEVVDSSKLAEIQKRFITLTDAELRNLNIVKTWNGFEYSNNFYANNQVNRMIIKTEGVGKNIRINDKLFVKPKITKRDKPFAPVALTDGGLLLFTAAYLYLYPDSISPSKEKLLSIREFANSYESLIPIRVDDESVMWFPETPELMKALPERVQHELGFIESNMNRAKAIPIKYIELSDEQLVKFGIKRNPSSITVPMHLGDNKYMFTNYSSGGSETSFTGFQPIDNDTKSSDKNVKIKINTATEIKEKELNIHSIKIVYPSPSLITEGNGLHWLCYEYDDGLTKEEEDSMFRYKISPKDFGPTIEGKKRGEKQLAKDLNTYIALKVKSNEKHAASKNTDSVSNPDLIIWYKPDSLLFASLPIELGEQIKQELENIRSNKPASSCNFFEICTNRNEAIESVLVYPNPVSGECKVNIVLTKRRKISFEIADATGRLVYWSTATKTEPEGLVELSVDLSNQADGMYLLRVETDKNEHFIQRIIVKK